MRRLEHAPELLDAPRHDRAELEQSLDQVAEVNRLLGGTRAVLHTLNDVVTGRFAAASPRTDDTRARSPAPRRAWTILDIGTGSADIPMAIDDWARRRAIDVRITATDLHPQMREIAAGRTRGRTSIRVEEANALDLRYADDQFDIVLLSLTLHHFEHDDQIRALREAARVANCAVIINELERCLPNYIGARLLAVTRWRNNRLTRHDGPLSVQRAFTLPELRTVAEAAGIRVFVAERRYFFRLVVGCWS